jgi:hypothetical protein
MVEYKGQMYGGEHEAIIAAETWESVQKILQRNGRSGGTEVRNNYGALLKGLLRCASCDAGMVHTYTAKGPRRYRYYVCEQAQQRGWENCETKSVSAPAIEAAVVQQIRRIGSDPHIAARAIAKAEEQRRGQVTDLTCERQLTQKELAGMGAELRKLVPLVGRRDQMVTDRMALLLHQLVQWIEQYRALRHPAAHGFARDVDAMPLEHLLLPVQRLVVSPLRHDHLRQQTRSRRALLDRLRRLGGSPYRTVADVLQTNVLNHLHHRNRSAAPSTPGNRPMTD